MTYVPQKYEKNSTSFGNNKMDTYLCYVFFMVLDFISREAEL